MTESRTSAGHTRRQVVKLGAGAAAAALLPAVADHAQAATRAGRATGAMRATRITRRARLIGPQGHLTGSATRRVAQRQFMPSGQMRSWYEQLDDRGLRATGSAEHEAYVDDLHDRLERLGVSEVTAEGARLRRWSAGSAALHVASGPSAGPVRIANYIPYSGVLPGGRATGELVFVADPATGAPPPAPGSLKGKIALFEVAIPPYTLADFALFATRIYEPSRLSLSSPYNRAWLAQGDAGAQLQALQAAGAAAAVGVLPLDDFDARGMYFPYDGLIRDIPGVYVARSEGARLRALASTGTRVRVQLATQVRTVATHNLYGFIPGASRELIVIHSHTDGPNGIEDDGPDTIGSIAQYLARIDRHALPRSVMVLYTSGHFAGGVGAIDWCRRHADDLVPRIAAAVTIEHVGAKEGRPQPDGTIRVTGDPEPGAFFMPTSAGLQRASYDMLRAAGRDPGLVCKPLTPNAKPDQAAWPGEGEYLWNNGGIPDTNYITGPTYLLNAGMRTVGYVDYRRLRTKAMAFTDMALALTRAPRASLRAPKPTHTG